MGFISLVPCIVFGPGQFDQLENAFHTLFYLDRRALFSHTSKKGDLKKYYLCKVLRAPQPREWREIVSSSTPTTCKTHVYITTCSRFKHHQLHPRPRGTGDPSEACEGQDKPRPAPASHSIIVHSFIQCSPLPQRPPQSVYFDTAANLPKTHEVGLIPNQQKTVSPSITHTHTLSTRNVPPMCCASCASEATPKTVTSPKSGPRR